jgi:putative transposase
MVGVPARVQAARYAGERGIGLRRACNLFGVARSMTTYRHLQPEKDKPMVEAIAEVSRENTSWGAPLIHGWLREKGYPDGISRVRRVWRAYGFAAQWKKKRRKLRTGARLKPQAMAPGSVWCMDFAEDRLLSGNKFFAFLVKDEASAYGLAVEVERSFKGVDVERVLDGLVEVHGAPDFIRCDNGGQFIAFVVKRWADRKGVQIAYIDPGKPWQNGSAESFVGTYRREVLNAELFGSLQEAKWFSERWRRKYNQERPHSRLGYRPPATAYPQIERFG